MKWFSNEGETVLDPFAGAGTTLVAAKAMGRKAVGIEIEERFCEVIARRLEQDTLPLAFVNTAPKATVECLPFINGGTK
jgi:DNA modification methylase